MDTINRLQFRHHEEIFETREDALKYICQTLPRDGGEGLAEPGSPYTRSLFAEPTILRYKNEEEESGACNDGCNKGPHIILVIGSQTNDDDRKPEENKYCIIDIDKTEEEIADLAEELEKAVKSLSIIALDSDTLNLYAEKTEDGTFVSGDVKTAETHVFDGIVKDNNLMIVPTDDPAGPEGLFIYVDLTYDDATETFTFVVTNADGTLKKQSVKLPNNYLVSGIYKKQDESIHLRMRNGDEVVVNCEDLIAEWFVEGEASKTPIVLTREEVEYDGTPEHHHVEPWQDVLRADVRIANDRPANILNKTIDGRYLYVDGEAENIRYEWNGEVTNVDEQLNRLNMTCRVSPDSDNIIRLEDGVGFFANATLNYISDENKLIFVTSCVNGGEIRKEIQLNTVEVIQSITYDPTTEELVIKYVNDKGEVKTLRVPMSGLIDEWTVLNDAHSVYLKRQRNISGADILTADVNISERENNILEEVGEGNLHMLYVKGTADNIKYKDTTVEGALDELAAGDEALNEKIDQEIERSTAEDEKIETTIGSGFTTDAHETITYKFEQLTEKVDNEIARSTSEDERIDAKLDDEIARSTSEDEAINEKIDQEIADRTSEIERIDTTIGSGFSTDAHETITYKFNQLQEQVNSEADKLQNEIDRSEAKDTEHDGRLDAIDAEIGDGFGPRATVRDAIDALSADTAASLKDIINNDNSIDVDRTNPVKPVIKVNLSGNEPYNTLRLEGDGLYNFIDLNYDPDTNKLTLTRSDNGSTENVSKELQLNSVSFIDDITYDPTTETLVITYHSGSEEKKVEINLGQIFQEWEVYNDPDSAVKLNRQRVIDGKDKLSGEVIISSAHTDNILENEHGALYVSGQQIEDNKNAIEGLTSDLADEIARALAAENLLTTNLNNEIIRATSAETALSGAINTVQTNLQNEIARATAEEGRIDTKLSNEITRSTTKDEELYQLIIDEQTRATEADAVLDAKINSVSADSFARDAQLEAKISGETAARTAQDTVITERLTNEITRSTTEDQRLNDAIQQEIADRQAGDAALAQEILDATIKFSPSKNNFESNGTIEFNNYENNNNIVEANVIIPKDDNIIVIDNGIKASVNLTYTASTNTLYLEKTDGVSGRTIVPIQLSAGSIIDNLYYDNESGEIVITYHDGAGNVQTMRFPASELFNEWIVQNPSEKSAVELTKVRATEQGQPDTLSARALITDDRDGDGKPDEGSDNIIEIRNNGLYVCGSAMTEAQDIALCVQNEIKVLEKAVIGHQIGEECGSGYTYEPNTQATYINTATSFNNADYILDQSIKNVEIKVDEVSAKTDCTKDELKAFEKAVLGNSISEECGEGFVYNPNLQATYINSATSFDNADFILDQAIKNVENEIIEVKEDVDCVDNKTNKTYELLYGVGKTMPQCGSGTTYQPYVGACIISGATSFDEADHMLNDAICEILTMWVSGRTCSTESEWVEDGANRKIEVHARLSRGNTAAMSDDDVFIETLNGDYIDPTRTEFTDTNALRIVCLQEGPSGTTPSVDTMQNGIYLSNVWDCGLYYNEATDADAIEAADAAGYVTDPYRTDTSSTASNYNYMNNVRQ